MLKNAPENFQWIMASFCLFLTAANVHTQETRLIAHWPMDEAPNGSVIDKSGSGNDAVIEGSVTFGPGKEGQAAFFNGSNGNCLTVRAPKSLDHLREFSIEGWVT
ncbi:MAG: hypothetical protein PHV34_24445 [Verrucomicrobiae bacterium]|nr:hypothetical protein [Verrucomicrobiae bacterium]